MAMPGQKFETKQRITVRNLRIREDTAKVHLEIIFDNGCDLIIMYTYLMIFDRTGNINVNEMINIIIVFIIICWYQIKWHHPQSQQTLANDI